MTKTIIIDEMVRTGVYLGHKGRKWNPKMAPFIYAEKNGNHIIDLIQTYLYLKKVSQFLSEQASKGKTFLFVGTKKKASRLIAKIALNCNSFYINQRWLGGILTNWTTIQTSIDKLNRLQNILHTKMKITSLSKKRKAKLKKQKEKLEKNLGGLKKMRSLPDVVIIVGQPEEIKVVRECRKLGIRSVTLLDTDCDPSLADFFVPANDDSRASLQFILNRFLEAIKKGQKTYKNLEKDSIFLEVEAIRPNRPQNKK